VVVPVRFPLTEHSERTLGEAIRVARERDAELTVLHVNEYHRPRHVSRTDLARAVRSSFADLPDTRFVVRKGFRVEETILDEVAAESADIVVIGHKQAGRWQRMLQTLRQDPDIDAYLDEHVDAALVRVGPDGGA
jgi:nucleotide-binding universal stress UspA family protein